jgi:hypothetical protein
MNRKTLDRLLASGGLVVAILLVVAGALMTWAHSYVHSEVRSQLAAQQIYFPDKGSPSLTALPASDRNAMTPYAGQQLLNGAQAKAWADHYIAVHLKEMTGGKPVDGTMTGGKTYSQLSGQYMAMTPAQQASKAGQDLNGLVQTVFRGETLRGLLLNAYAFDTMGNIALLGAIVSYIGAGALFVLAGLGFRHAHRVAIGTAARMEMPERERIHS